MTITRHYIPFGTTEPQDFQVRDLGVPVNGLGWTVGLEITDEDGVEPATPPTVDWLDAATGKVRVSGVENLAVGTYLVRYKLTDSGGDFGYAPNGKYADTWIVVPVAQGA